MLPRALPPPRVGASLVPSPRECPLHDSRLRISFSGVAIGIAIDQLLLYAAGRLCLSIIFGSPTADTDDDAPNADPEKEKPKKKRGGESSPKERLTSSANNIKKVPQHTAPHRTAHDYSPRRGMPCHTSLTAPHHITSHIP